MDSFEPWRKDRAFQLLDIKSPAAVARGITLEPRNLSPGRCRATNLRPNLHCQDVVRRRHADFTLPVTRNQWAEAGRPRRTHGQRRAGFGSVGLNPVDGATGVRYGRLPQFGCRIDLFTEHADFNVHKIRSDALEVRFNPKPGCIGDMQQAMLVRNDVILRHGSGQ